MLVAFIISSHVFFFLGHVKKSHNMPRQEYGTRLILIRTKPFKLVVAHPLVAVNVVAVVEVEAEVTEEDVVGVTVEDVVVAGADLSAPTVKEAEVVEEEAEVTVEDVVDVVEPEEELLEERLPSTLWSLTDSRESLLPEEVLRNSRFLSYSPS